MFKAPAIIILSLALAGCAAFPSTQAFKNSADAPHYAWDGAGEDPNQPKAAPLARSSAARHADPERGKEAASLRGDAEARREADDQNEADSDRRLNRALAICRGCLRPQQGDERMAGLRE